MRRPLAEHCSNRTRSPTFEPNVPEVPVLLTPKAASGVEFFGVRSYYIIGVGYPQSGRRGVEGFTDAT
jgi:hypothetical protein